MLLAVASAGMWCVGFSMASVSVANTAGDAARALARGEEWSDVVSRVEVSQPEITLRANESEGLVTVIAVRDIAPVGGLLRGVSMTIERAATAPMEWSAGELA